jgi:O-antigen ligase
MYDIQMSKPTISNSLTPPVWLFLVAPIVINLYFDVNAADPFNTPKFILLILITFYMLSYVIVNFKCLDFKLWDLNSKTYLLFSLFIIALFFSLLNTDQKFIGLFGESQRKNGFLTYFMLSILFLYSFLVANFRTANKLVVIAAGNGLLNGIYGLMQFTGNDFVKWNNPYNPVITTTGNPNFASAILAMFAVISFLLLFIKSLSIYFKIILLLTSSLSLAVVFLSDSIQGLVLFVFSVFFYMTIYVSKKHRKYRIIAASIFLLIGFISILGMLQIGPLSQILYKQSVSVRGYYWRAGLSMFLDKPFFGVGLDRYGAYFREYREVGYPLKYGFDITSTDAHNTVIQMFATGGLLVGLLYLVINLYVFYTGIKLIRKVQSENFQLSLIIFSAWVGFQAQSIISINNLGSAVWGWTLGGLIIGLERSIPENFSLANGPHKNSLAKQKINLTRSFIATLLLIPAISMVVLLNRAEENAYIVRGFSTIAQDAQDRSIAKLYSDKIINNPLSDPINKLIASRVLVSAGFPELGFAQIDKIIENDPRDQNALEYTAEARKIESKYSDAIDAREKIAVIDPWNANNLLDLIELYINYGEMNKALDVYNYLLDFAPNSDQAKNGKELLASAK